MTIVPNKLVFIQQPHTASTFIRYFLREIYPKTWIETGNHHPLKDIPDKYKKLFKCVSIRNPWSWYVSTHQFHLRDKTPQYYKVIDKYKKFNFNNHMRFFKEIVDRDNQSYGFYTSKLIGRCFYESKINDNWKDLNNTEFDVDFFIKKENIIDDIIQMFNEYIEPLSEKNIDLLHKSKKVNVSEIQDYRGLYDNFWKEYVREKDNYLIKKYNYEF